MTIKKAGIWCNLDKAEALEVSERLMRALVSQGVTVCADSALAQQSRGNVPIGFDGCDVLITLGGDGTLLAGLGEALRLDVPMLGVNLGHLGFLTEIEPDSLEESVKCLVAGNFHIEERMLVSAGAYPDDYALNEVTVTRAPSSMRILTMTVYSDGELIQRFSGDGLIVATPTGSTGYSLSAGGPLVMPGADLMLLTPVCAHTPHAKPTVVPASARVEVCLQDQCEGAISADGRFLGTLSAGGRIEIFRSQRKVRFIRLGEDGFFSRLRSKLLDWGR